MTSNFEHIFQIFNVTCQKLRHIDTTILIQHFHFWHKYFFPRLLAIIEGKVENEIMVLDWKNERVD